MVHKLNNHFISQIKQIIRLKKINQRILVELHIFMGILVVATPILHIIFHISEIDCLIQGQSNTCNYQSIINLNSMIRMVFWSSIWSAMATFIVIEKIGRFKDKIIDVKTFSQICQLLKDNKVQMKQLENQISNHPITYGYMEKLIDEIVNQDKEKPKEHQMKQQLSVIKRY